MQESPLVLGTVYLHWYGSYEMYHAFFAHLRCKLDNINISGLEFGIGDLIVGPDEQRALTKQWKLVFHKQLHFIAVDILTKICDDDCRIKSAFHRNCGRISSGMSLVQRDLQAGTSG